MSHKDCSKWNEKLMKLLVKVRVDLRPWTDRGMDGINRTLIEVCKWDAYNSAINPSSEPFFFLGRRVNANFSVLLAYFDCCLVDSIHHKNCWHCLKCQGSFYKQWISNMKWDIFHKQENSRISPFIEKTPNLFNKHTKLHVYAQVFSEALQQ